MYCNRNLYLVQCKRALKTNKSIISTGSGLDGLLQQALLQGTRTFLKDKLRTNIFCLFLVYYGKANFNFYYFNVNDMKDNTVLVSECTPISIQELDDEGDEEFGDVDFVMYDKKDQSSKYEHLLKTIISTFGLDT